MKIRNLDPTDLNRHRKSLIQFITKHGDQRITAKALRWLTQLPAEDFAPGTLLTVILYEEKLAGFIAFADYGRVESFIVVHPAVRERNVGEHLVRHSLTELGRVYTRVSLDNVPSLKLCFRCGLHAFRLIKGPTGKPTFWLGGGDWKAEEIPQEEELLQ